MFRSRCWGERGGRGGKCITCSAPHAPPRAAPCVLTFSFSFPTRGFTITTALTFCSAAHHHSFTPLCSSSSLHPLLLLLFVALPSLVDDDDDSTTTTTTTSCLTSPPGLRRLRHAQSIHPSPQPFIQSFNLSLIRASVHPSSSCGSVPGLGPTTSTRTNTFPGSLARSTSLPDPEAPSRTPEPKQTSR